MSEHPRATTLLMEVMGVEGPDTQLPLPVLINLHRRELTQPLERLLKKLGGHHYHPALRLDRALDAANERWPALHDGEIFQNDKELIQIWNTQPETDSYQEYVIAAARNPSEIVAQLLIQPQDWHVVEPVLLLHQFTWTDTTSDQVPIVLAMLDRELELDPAVEDMIRTGMRL